MPEELHRYRQIHLDFHTAAQCQGVGEQFDAASFVETLQMGHVDTINLFAKCHHGYSYYPTQIGTMHPNLKFDLLGAQVEALHRADIRCPIYVSVKWDDLSGSQHPDWVCVGRDGRLVMRPPASGIWGWTTLDISTSYGEFFLSQVEEICRRFGEQLDGFWFDITFPVPNYSPWSQDRMRQAGVDIGDEAAVFHYARQQDLRFFEKLSKLVKDITPQATIYYNGTTTPDMGEVAPYVTHFEVESLPTSGGQWGYLHYPVVARHARTFGKEIIGMTGRFHRSWADFGGLKTSDQLEYECGTILAAGGKICVGDQLHPNGRLDPAVYRLIGHAYQRVEQLEPWLQGAYPVAEVGILALGKPPQAIPGVAAYSPEVEGAAQLLLESAIQFDVADRYSDLSQYACLILPDEAALDADWQARLSEYLAEGGRLILSGTAALDPASQKFQLEEIPVAYLGPAPTVPSYLRLNEALAGEGELASDYDYVFYDQAHLVAPVEGAEAHGDLRQALFNRTWEHFTSHAQAPVGDSLGSPLVVRKDRVLYFAVPLLRAYRDWDYWVYREVARNALRNFLNPPMIVPQAPGWVEFTLHEQPETDEHPSRRIVHVVAYQPRRTHQPIPHVDQYGLTAGLSFKLRVRARKPRWVYLALDKLSLPYWDDDEDYIHIALPPVGAHTVVVIE